MATTRQQPSTLRPPRAGTLDAHRHTPRCYWELGGGRWRCTTEGSVVVHAVRPRPDHVGADLAADAGC